MTGDDDTGSSSAAGVLVASDGKVASAVRHPAGDDPDAPAATSGTATAGPTCATTTRWTGPTRRPSPGNVVQTGGSRSPAWPGTAASPWRIGFGRHRAQAAATTRGLGLSRGFAQALAAYAAGWHAYLRDAAPGARQRRPLHHRVERLGDGARRERGQDLPRRASSPPRAGPGRGPTSCRTCPSTTRSGRATSTRSRPGCSRSATTPPPTARSTTCGSPAAAGRVLPAELPPRRRAGLRRPADGRGRLPDRAGLAARPTRRGRLGSTSSVGRLHRRQRPEHAAGALGEHRRLLAGHDRRRDRRPRAAPPTSPGATATPPAPGDVPADRRQLAAPARALDRDDATGRSTRSPTTCGSPRTATPTPAPRSRSRDGGPAHRPAVRRRPELPRPGPPRRASRPATRSIRNSLTVVDEQLGYSTPNGPFWHRASFDGYGEKRDGSQWEPSDPGSGKTHRPRLAAADRRARGVRACRPATTLRTDHAATRWPGRRDDRSHFMPEQVWDDQPPSGSAGLHAGRAHLLGDAAGVDARAVRPAGPQPRRRATTSRPRVGRLPLRDRGLLTRGSFIPVERRVLNPSTGAIRQVSNDCGEPERASRGRGVSQSRGPGGGLPSGPWRGRPSAAGHRVPRRLRVLWGTRRTGRARRRRSAASRRCRPVPTDCSTEPECGRAT